ncbi:MAG: ferric reductase-like transmembrane domain-containing protein [Vitreoscilla sp.]|nr:ferric reductase-like transmembrane domain-containing protein [Vitreoscilla sp.]
MKRTLLGLAALITGAWAWELWDAASPAGASLPWTVRQQGLYLSGLLSIGYMSLAMALATRPAWLERPLGGLDRIYRLHKWAGILAVGLAVVHWLVEMSDKVLKALVGREGRAPKEHFQGLLEVLRELAEDMGEWAIYALLAMLALTLWKRFPYRPWRHLHRAMPALYLMAAMHAVLLAPTAYWQRPVGALMGLLLAAGGLGAVLSLGGWIGRQRQVAGQIVAVRSLEGGITEVRCRVQGAWPGHRAGQFAFVSFDPAEGQHPFTIASADRGDHTLSFQIKALGDYTGALGRRLQVGQAVQIEGPYGRFDLARRDLGARQVWVAGGIGVTPFLAWLESLQTQPHNAPEVELHYCTRDRDSDPFVPRLQALCAALPGVRLQVHGALQGQVLQPATLEASLRGSQRAELWFCGPQGLAQALHSGLAEAWPGRLRLHQEAFEMR